LKSDVLQDQIIQIENEYKPLVERYNTILYTEENLSTLNNKLLTSKENLKSIKSTQQELKSVIKFKFEENDSKLDEALNNFNRNML